MSPLRAKNPPESFPYCTVGLIVVNFIVYLCTTYHLVITDGAVQAAAVSYDDFSLWRVVSSLFLHVDPMHIGGNMLFLGVFGAAVEGRLKAAKFLLIYLAAGIIGSILNNYVFGPNEPAVWNLGASGAIMGIMGAYLYMFPFSYMVVFWIWQVQAMWLIAFFVLQDILSGFVFSSVDGVNHFAHLSGIAIGYLLAAILRPRTDSIHVSQVKSVLVEMRDPEMLSLRELEILLRNPTDDARIVMIYCRKAVVNDTHRGLPKAIAMVKRYEKMLVDHADPSLLASFLMGLPPKDEVLPTIIYLRLGTRLEQADNNDLAAHIYRRIYDLAPNGRYTEAALYRLARLLEQVYDDCPAAIETYRAMLDAFPTGPLSAEGHQCLLRLTSEENQDQPFVNPPRPERKLELIAEPITQILGQPSSSETPQPPDGNDRFGNMLEF